jgi:hypothetical protein
MAGMKLRFSVRELLLAIAVVALAIGWWIDHRRAGKAAQLSQLQVNVLQARMVDANAEVRSLQNRLRPLD